ncbi:MAG TPA: TonB-dependent receptor [Gemmatimonadaceae bacterium]|nr:TonB-dependent receptor [Gemmatimonadaceae bacterium]
MLLTIATTPPPALIAQTTQAGGTGRITGIVADRVAGAPIANVSITISGTTLGARTGVDGRYTINEVPAGAQHLRAARIGYSPTEQAVTVAAGQTATVNLSMAQATITLDQVVVVGYGTQKRSDLTGSVASVTPNVDQTPVLSLEQTLQGAAPGVMVTQASSAPGGALSIRIRGGSSVTGNNEPLYVIDGFPIENDPDAQNPSDGGRDASTTVPSDPLSALNPNDIESIEILKDASATSIYGARGANGVIIITTKHGQSARPRFTIDSYAGTQSVAHRYDLLNAQQFAQFVNTWSVNNGTGVLFANPDTLPNTDWQSLIFRSAPISNLQVGVTGGGSGLNATRYALSGGVFQQQGVVINSSFRRVSLRANLDQNVGENLHLSSTASVSRVSSNSVPTDGSLNAGAGAVGAAIDYFPILPVRQANGAYTLMGQSNLPSVLQPTNIPNPVSMANDVVDRIGDTRILANGAGEYQFSHGFKFRSTFGADLGDRSRDTYFPRTTLQGSQTNGYAKRGTTNTTNWLNENLLSFDRDFNNSLNQVSAIAGYTRQQSDLVNSNIQNSQFVSDIDNFESIGAGTQTGGPQVGSSHTRWTLASYLGRVNYTLANRYLFTVTGREDGSSRFGADHQWGFFPSAAFGWRVSDEPFMAKHPSIELLKFRASYGLAGNPSIRPYQSMAHLLPQQYTFGGTVVPGYFTAVIGNPNLGWETTRQLDLGADLGLWGGRLSFTADMYRKKTSDLLLAVNLPFESGFTTALQNVGAVQNNGYELGLTLTILDTKAHALGWTSTLNYSHNKNKVLDLGGVQQIFANSINSDLKLLGTLIQVGQPLGVFYGYQAGGILRDSASAATYTAQVKPLSGTKWNPGDVKLLDVADTLGRPIPDGRIDAHDRTIIGDPNPKFTAGWQNTFSFGRFRLSSMMDAVYGNKILNMNNVRLEQGSPGTNIVADRFTDAWTPTNPDAKFPRVNFTPGTIGSDITSDLLEDGSFLRLRSLTLDAAVPERLLSRAGLSNTRVYVTGANLYTWTHYSGFNPDVSSLGIGNVNRGIDVGAYPLAKSITFGINLTY